MVDFTLQQPLEKDVLKMMIKIEVYEKLFLRSKHIDNVYIPLSGLQGNVSFRSSGQFNYMNKPVALTVVLF